MTTANALSLPAQTLDDAPARGRGVLDQAKAKLGFIPNMYTRMAHSPGLLETYMHGYDVFRKESGFSPVEQEVVFLSISRTNECHYCVAAHSTLADTKSGVPPAVTDAIRDGAPIPDTRLAALSAFTQRMVESRGRPTDEDIEHFLDAGYSERQVVEIVLAIGVKTLSNYVNHLFNTPVDEVFAGRAWMS